MERLKTMLGCVFSAALVGCAGGPTVSELVATSAPLEQPRAALRPTESLLSRFGDMLLAYRVTDDPVVIGIDYIPNDSGLVEELPSDLGFYVEAAMDAIGAQVRPVRAIPASAYVNTFGVGTVPPPRQPSRPVEFRVQGCLLRASELASSSRDLRGDAFATRGSESLDVRASRDKTDSLANLRVLLTLTDPLGNTLPGCSVTYDINVFEIDRRTSVGFFISGSGGSTQVGHGIADDLGNALYDATAACIVHLVGNALEIPYDRLGAPFAPDDRLARRRRDNLGRLTQLELEQEIRRLMFASGAPVNLATEWLTSEDRQAVLMAFLKDNRSSNEHEEWIDFAHELWSKLPFEDAADAVEQRLAAQSRDYRERWLAQNASEARRQAEARRLAEESAPASGQAARPSGAAAEAQPEPGQGRQMSTELARRTRALEEARTRALIRSQTQPRAPARAPSPGGR